MSTTGRSPSSTWGVAKRKSEWRSIQPTLRIFCATASGGLLHARPVYRKKGSKFYYVNIWIDGREFSRSTKRTNEREAKSAIPEIERRLRAELSAALDASVSLTLDAVAGRYMLDVGDHHAGADNTRRLVAQLIVHFGPAKLITEITHEDAQGLIRWRRIHTVGKRKPRPISPYAVNDTTEQLKKLFTYLRPWLAKANPDKKPFPLEPEWSKLWLEPKRKPSELVGSEEERLVRAVFTARPDLWPLIEFARTCGKRKTNCYTLTWDQVDGDAGIIRSWARGGPAAKRSSSRSPRACMRLCGRSADSIRPACSHLRRSGRPTR